MKRGFWDLLKKPIVCLSPMDGVTDQPMRFIAKKYGSPDVIYTEFVSVEGLWRIEKRGEKDHRIWRELGFDKSQTPVVAQLFGSDPDSFYEATRIVSKMGFAGIDINMGCPSPGLEKRGGGAGLIRDKERARSVIEAVRRGVADEKAEICVSVKTRLGSGEPERDWWNFLAGMELPLVAMHGRTFKQLYSGEANWDTLVEASMIVRESGALFLGNGDVAKILPDNKVQLTSGRTVDLENNFDGVLVGRRAIGNPWALRRDGYEPGAEEKLRVAVEHARVFEEVNKIYGGANSKGRFEVMRKHLSWYAHGFEDASQLRRKLVQTSSADEVEEIVEEYLDLAN